jgi:6-phosphogluconate dehydrogenase
MPKTKEMGVVGLGDMGGNIARVLHSGGYTLAVYNKAEDKYAAFSGMENINISKDITDLVAKLNNNDSNSVVWVMVPAGDATREVISELSTKMKKDDIVIDGSNSTYEDSMNNCKILKDKDIHYFDVGCAGGPSSIGNSISLMVGGDKALFHKIEDVFKTVSGKGSYGYVGENGSGVRTKSVHNCIFYGIFPVYAEGTELLDKFVHNSPNDNFDMKEALRLLSVSPPITVDVMNAIAKAYKDDSFPKVAPDIKVSEMVKSGVKEASSSGVELGIISAILNGYTSMSEKTRIIYAAAKKIITGH